MVMNKYLCATIKTSDVDATKYLFYTFNEEQLPVRYFIALYSWDNNPEYYDNYTACSYIKVPK
jgi:hypothetical protein